MTTTLTSPETPTTSGAEVPRALTVAAFTANFDRFAIGPILLAVSTGLHARLGAVVSLASGYALAYGLSQPLWGILSDRIGRLRVIRTALALAALAGVASALSPSLPVLLVLRFLAGFAFGAVVPSSLSFVGDSVPPRRRQSALADLMAALGLGTGLAALFAGVVAHWLSWRLVFVVPALSAGLALLALRRVPEPGKAPALGLAAQLTAVLRNRFAYLVMALGVVEGAVLLGGLTFVAPALQHEGLSSAVAGALTALYGAGTMGFTRAVKALTTRIQPYGLAAIGGALVLAGYLPAAIAPNIWTVSLVALLLGAGWAFLHSTLQTWATSIVPEARGTAVSCYVGFLFVGSAAGAALGGTAAQHAHFGAIFGVAALATIPLTAAVVVGRRRFVAHG